MNTVRRLGLSTSAAFYLTACVCYIMQENVVSSAAILPLSLTTPAPSGDETSPQTTVGDGEDEATRGDQECQRCPSVEAMPEGGNKEARTDPPMCPLPSHQIFLSPALYGCAQVALGQVVNTSSATSLCWDTFSFIGGPSVTLYAAGYYDVSLEESQALLSNNSNYTVDLLVNAEWDDQAWRWPDGTRIASTVQAVGLPQGGTGSEDYKLLYMKANDGFLLHAAREGRDFGGALCRLVTDLM